MTKRPFTLALPLLLAACGSSASSPDVADSAVSVDDSGIDASTPDTVEAAPSDAPPTPFDQLVARMKKQLATYGVPGASIAVVVDGKLAHAAGVGVRNVATGEPVTTKTVFSAASLSKMIVAAMAMTLVEQGKLDLDAPITRYLPWFTLAPGFDATSVTTKTLLSHTSGFPCDLLDPCGATTSGARNAFFRANPEPLWAPAGAVYDYSNIGFGLAASVLEAAAGTPEGSYEQLAHDRILAPAGMTTATFDVAAAAAGDHSLGYKVDTSGTITATIELGSYDCALGRPPGGVRATPTDYAHFAEILLADGGAVLAPSSVANMEAAHADLGTFVDSSYGYGVLREMRPYADYPSIWHDGDLPGFRSELWIVPHYRFAVAVMVNTDSLDLADAFVSDALRTFITDPRSSPTLRTVNLIDYVGTYDDSFGTLGKDIVITVSGKSLLIDAPNAVDLTGAPAPLKGNLAGWSGSEFMMPNGVAATFYPDASGKTKYLVSRVGVGIRKP